MRFLFLFLLISDDKKPQKSSTPKSHLNFDPQKFTSVYRTLQNQYFLTSLLAKIFFYNKLLQQTIFSFSNKQKNFPKRLSIMLLIKET